MKQTTDILLLGGGVIGCAIAYSLRQAGRDVLLLERGEIGGQASGAAAGLLAPLGPLSGPGPYADLVLAGCTLLTSLVSQLEAESGIALGYEQTGALRTVRNPKRVDHLRQRMNRWSSLGLEMTWMTGEEARKQEPPLSTEICAAVWVPQEAQIHAPQVVQAFSRVASNAGAQISSHKEVIGIRSAHRSVTGVVLSDQNEIACQHLIVATGAWSAQCGTWLKSDLPVRPVRGQILALRQPPQPLRHIVFGEGIYLVPRGETIVVGATKEETGFDVQVTSEGLAWLQTTAERLVPALRESRVERAWAGVRPGTPDKRPLLGSLPHWNNVTLAIGHNSVGVMLSAITGQMIADTVLTGDVPALMRPFSVERL